MITHHVELDLDAVPQAVFDWLTDARNHPRWDDTSVEMELLQPGPWRAGSEFREVRRMGGRRVEFRSRLASLERGRGFDTESLSGPEFHGHWRVEPAGSTTRLRWWCEMKVGGPARLVEPLIARSFRRQVSANFARLKTLIEADLGSQTRGPEPRA